MGEIVDLNEYRKRRAVEKKKKKQSRPVWHPSMGDQPNLSPSQFSKMSAWSQDELDAFQDYEDGRAEEYLSKEDYSD